MFEFLYFSTIYKEEKSVSLHNCTLELCAAKKVKVRTMYLESVIMSIERVHQNQRNVATILVIEVLESWKLAE